MKKKIRRISKMSKKVKHVVMITMYGGIDVLADTGGTCSQRCKNK